MIISWRRFQWNGYWI